MASNSFRTFIDSLPWRFFRKLALMQVLVTTFVIIATAYMSRYYLKTYLTNQAYEQIKESLEIIKQSITSQNISPKKWCEGLQLNSKTRFTIINSKGRPVCDNFVNPLNMKNLSNQKEILEASENEVGFHVRHSKSHASELLFGANKISHTNNKGQIETFTIRQALSLDRREKAMQALDQSITLFLFPLLILASLVSLWTTLQISFPIRSILNKIDKMKRINGKEEDSIFLQHNDEWGVLEQTLDRAHGDIQKYLGKIYNENVKITTLMESISDSIIAVSENGAILFANRHFIKNFLPKGIQKKDLHKFRIWELTRDLEIQKMVDKAFTRKTIVKQRNAQQMSRPRGGDIYFDITISPLNDQNENPFGVVCIFHDVSDKVLAGQMREDFVANVSHEVRSPLTALKGYTQMLRSVPLEKKETIDNCLNKIERNADRLIELFSDILNLSMIESKQKLNKKAVFTEDLTSNVIANVKQSYPEKNMEIITEYHIEEVRADPA